MTADEILFNTLYLKYLPVHLYEQGDKMPKDKELHNFLFFNVQPKIMFEILKRNSDNNEISGTKINGENFVAWFGQTFYNAIMPNIEKFKTKEEAEVFIKDFFLNNKNKSFNKIINNLYKSFPKSGESNERYSNIFSKLAKREIAKEIKEKYPEEENIITV
jgi:hypothetical protein